MIAQELAWKKGRYRQTFWVITFKLQGNKTNTFTATTPTVASRPISAAPNRSPDFSTIVPCAMSEPWKRQF